MESLGGFIDPSLSTPRSTTPSNPSLSSSTPTTSDSTPSQANERRDSESATTLDLDKEVQNVIAGFGSFWGKVRKQSTAAFFTAEKQLESTRKDLNPLLSKARANLDTFSTAARAEVQRLSEVQQPSSSGGGGGVVIGADGLPMIIGSSEEEEQELRRKEKGKGVDRSESTSTQSQSQENPAAAASAFFAKLQSQLSSTVQDQAPAALHSLSSNFTQFQDQLSHLNLKDLKNPAESYLHKGEAWLGEFQKEVSKLAKEAVTIVPPSLSGQAAEEVRPRKSEDSFRGLTRKDGLLFKLRSDPTIFLIDPSFPPLPSSNDLTDLRDSYSTFLSTLPQDLAQSEMVQEAKEDGGEVLEKTRKEVVSSGDEGEGENGVSEEEFWKRYLFRVNLIEAEEEKRKKVLNVAQSEEDDFTWDLDEEESLASASQSQSQATSPPPSSTTIFPPTSSVPPTSSSTTPTPLTSTQPQIPSTSSETPSSFAQSKPPISPTSTGSIEGSPPALIEPSPRNSSEEDGESRGTRTSYDFVGERSGNPSVDGEGADRDEDSIGVKRVEEGKQVAEEKKEEEDSEDSDWE